MASSIKPWSAAALWSLLATAILLFMAASTLAQTSACPGMLVLLKGISPNILETDFFVQISRVLDVLRREGGMTRVAQCVCQVTGSNGASATEVIQIMVDPGYSTNCSSNLA